MQFLLSAHSAHRSLLPLMNSKLTLIGGVQQGGKRGHGAMKSIVAIAVEMKQLKGGFGRIWMRCIPDVSGSSLTSFVCDEVAPGSIVLGVVITN